jgi:hypothetical protein
MTDEPTKDEHVQHIAAMLRQLAQDMLDGHEISVFVTQVYHTAPLSSAFFVQNQDAQNALIVYTTSILQEIQKRMLKDMQERRYQNIMNKGEKIEH